MSLLLFLRENAGVGRFENAISGTRVFICGQVPAPMNLQWFFCDRTVVEEGLPGGWRLWMGCVGGWWTGMESHLYSTTVPHLQRAPFELGISAAPGEQLVQLVLISWFDSVDQSIPNGLAMTALGWLPSFSFGGPMTAANITGHLAFLGSSDRCALPGPAIQHSS